MSQSSLTTNCMMIGACIHIGPLLLQEQQGSWAWQYTLLKGQGKACDVGVGALAWCVHSAAVQLVTQRDDIFGGDISFQLFEPMQEPYIEGMSILVFPGGCATVTADLIVWLKFLKQVFHCCNIGS